MTGKEYQKVASAILDTYEQKTKESRAYDMLARDYLPGGDTRSSCYYRPYPVCMVRGEECHLYDRDGNEYLDFLSNHTCIIHGHAHPRIIEAAREQMERGTIFGAPSEIQHAYARHLCERVPSMDTVRFCNSGTEATLFALRAARAFTGRDAILKMNGGYQGTHDVAEVNLHPDVDFDDLPTSNVTPGVPASTMNDVVIAPFNDLEATEILLKQHKDRLAAIIVEPILGAAGMISPRPDYLKGLRELTNQYDILLIFDEVISFRIHRGGMQALEGVTPDLTALGKMIGGGFPIGAFGGRNDIMHVFHPDHPNAVLHGGSFNGNNVSMGAGLIALDLYDQPAVDRINGLGNRLRQGFEDAYKAAGIKMSISGQGSLLGVHWCPDAPQNARQAVLGKSGAGELPRLLHLEMVNQGIHSAPGGLYIVSVPMAEPEIDKAVEAFASALNLLKPCVNEDFPHLLVD